MHFLFLGVKLARYLLIYICEYLKYNEKKINNDNHPFFLLLATERFMF